MNSKYVPEHIGKGTFYLCLHTCEKHIEVGAISGRLQSRRPQPLHDPSVLNWSFLWFLDRERAETVAENGLVDRERNVRNRLETRNSVDSFVSGAERTETVAANGGSIARIWIVRSFRADFWSQLRTLLCLLFYVSHSCWFQRFVIV